MQWYIHRYMYRRNIDIGRHIRIYTECVCVMFYSPQMLFYSLALLRPMHGHWWVWPYPGIGPIVYEDSCFEPLVLSGHPLTHILVLSQLKLLHVWCVHVWCVHVWCVHVWCVHVWCVHVWCVHVWCGTCGWELGINVRVSARVESGA